MKLKQFIIAMTIIISAPIASRADSLRTLYGNIAGKTYLQNHERQPLSEVNIVVISDSLRTASAIDSNVIITDRGKFVLPDFSRSDYQATSDSSGFFLIPGIETDITARTYTIIAVAEGFDPIIFHQIPIYPGASMHVNLEIVFREGERGKLYVPDDPDLPLIYGKRMQKSAVPARTDTVFTLYATREGLVGYMTANGHIIEPYDHFVAMPYVGVLCSYEGYEFQVKLTYEDSVTVAPVWDIGPWNIHDNHFDPEEEREIYQYLYYGGEDGGLGIGLPESQAAYYQNFNQGYDEFNRQVLNPAGIDLADGTFWIALGMWDNDWIQVEYLWQNSDVEYPNISDFPPNIHLSNYPNPFNPTTTIEFTIPHHDAKSHVFLGIYDVSGKLIKTLLNEKSDSKYQSIIWDGTNENAEAMPSGVYLYRLEIEEFSRMKRCILLR